MHYNFPTNLVKQVVDKWNTTITGQYIPPSLPSKQHLKILLEVAYLVSQETDEGRHLNFTLCCTPNIDNIYRQLQDEFIEVWPLVTDREFGVQEVKRLAAATNSNTSAIWIRCPDDPKQPVAIHGLLNIGASWASARNAFTYEYENLPDALLIRVPAPGTLLVYQGQYLIASLSSGEIHNYEFTPISLLGAYPLFGEGQELLRSEIPAPIYEEAREWHQFEWLSYVNTILSITNTIDLRGHGGAVIFPSKKCKLVDEEFVKIKYSISNLSNNLKRKFVEFMTLRHRFGDMLYLTETQNSLAPAETSMKLVLQSVKEAQLKLSETCKFIGGLSGTDGAIVLRTDLSVDGFGAEILLDKVKRTKVYKISGQFGKKKEELDSEQFGMRHRSAMRLCSALHDLVIFVISQDGGKSLVWNDNGDTCFKSGLNTTNMNMVLA